MTEKLFERYVREGANTLTLDQVRAVLRWQAENPVEALQLRTRHAAGQREEAAKDALRATWLNQGGDAAAFEVAHREITADERRAKLATMEREAHAAAWKQMQNGF